MTAFRVDINADRDPLVNLDLEMALLGAVLVNNEAYHRAREAAPIRSHDFADAAHAAIWQAIAGMVEAGKQASAPTLRQRFQDDAMLSDVGGARYLVELAAQALDIIDAPTYAREIVKLRRKRDLRDVIHRAHGRLADAEEFDTPPEAVIDEIEGGLLAITDTGRADDDPVSLYDATCAALDDAEEARRTGRYITGLATGFRDLDDVLGGIQDDELIVIGGRAGMGKTAFALALAMRAAKAGTGVAIFSCEMGAKALARRTLAGDSGTTLGAVKRGRYDDEEARALREIAAGFRGLPVWIFDSAGVTPGQMRTRVRRLARRHSVGLVIVDHLQIMRADGGSKNDNRTNEIGRISGGLKALAKTLRTPVVALSQLSRDVEKRDDKRPSLADLRDGGTIEQDADAVLFLYRPSYYDKPPKRMPGESDQVYRHRVAGWEADRQDTLYDAEIVCGKVRDGEAGRIIHMHFDPSRMRWGDRTRQTEAPF